MKKAVWSLILVLSLLIVTISFAQSFNFGPSKDSSSEDTDQELTYVSDSPSKIEGQELDNIDEPGIITLDPANLIIAKGKNSKINPLYDQDQYGKNAVFKWSSSDKKVATVNTSGTVQGVAAGETTVTCEATFKDGTVATVTAKVTVYQPVQTFTAKASTLKIFAGQTLDAPDVTIKPANADYKTIEWTSSDKSVVTVNKTGKITGVAGGKATLTGTLQEPGIKTQKSIKIQVTVTQSASSIVLSDKSITIGKGKTKKITATVKPDTTTDKKVKWSSSDEKIATVSNGTITGKKSGSCTITVSATDGSGVSASVKVTVITAVSSITTKKKSIAVMLNGSERVDYTIAPKDASNKSLTWHSSNSSIATVSNNGTITGKRTGQCTVTATAADGSGASITWTVYVEPVVPVEVDSIHWQTTWGVKNGKMGVYGTNLCNYRRIKSFECTIECTSGWGNTVTSDFTYSGPMIAPGKSSKSKLSTYSVSGFTNAYTIRVTVTAVTFDDGTRYVIPTSSRYSTYFTM